MTQEKSGQGHNKFFSALLSLSADEHKAFVMYLQSPFFGRSKVNEALTAEFIAQIRKGNERPDKEAAWRSIGAKKTYDDQIFRKHCSNALQQLQVFLLHHDIQKNPENYETEMLELAVRKRISPLQSGLFRKVEQNLSKSFGAQRRFLKRYIYEMQRSIVDVVDENKVGQKLNFEEVSDSLDVYFVFEKLKLFSLVNSQQKVFRHNYRLSYQSEIIEWAKQFANPSSPEVSLYLYVLLLQTEPDNPEHFRQLKDYLLEHGARINRSEALNLFEHAMNYCIGQINAGLYAFRQEYLDLANFALDNQIFLTDNQISSWHYLNIAAVVLGMGNIEWVERFIQDYKEYLPERSRENIYRFNMARLRRFQGRYSDVLDLLRHVEFEDSMQALLGKMLLIITYYELRELEALHNFLDTFQTFLRRQEKLPEMRKKSFINFVKYVRRLAHVIQLPASEKEKLRAEIEKNKSQIANAAWLLQKLNAAS